MKITVVAGARPNFMKVAPILDALRKRAGSRPDLAVQFVHTGQHYDEAMSESFLRELAIPAPDVNLGVGSGSHAEQTAKVMVAFERYCLEQKPDWVLVVGDVNSTLACALAAKKLCIGVAHVEAGLRSGDRTMPEEINRLCTDAVSDLFFTTDDLADHNLIAEGVPAAKIHMVGNTMIDTLLRHLPTVRQRPLPDGLEAERFGVLTLHRPSNVDSPEVLGGIMDAVHDVARHLPVAFPVHPRTRQRMAEFGLMDRVAASGNVRLMDPLSYLPFMGLISRSRLILTDSGGIQEEATVLGKPCLTMRHNTERPITCSLGTNVLVGTDPERIRQEAAQALNGSARRGAVPDKWDGQAGRRIVDVLLQ